MNTKLISLAVTTLVVAGLFGSVTQATAAVEQKPNITPYPAADLRTERRSDGSLHLRFSTLSWNNGTGPLEIRGGTVDSSNNKQQVVQRIYSSDGTYRDVSAGFFDWHAAHAHIHFNDYAVYTLQPVNAPGASDRTGTKITFCIMDTNRVNFKLPGAPKRAKYTTCGANTQGMSVGWGDKYGYHLDGQSIDISGLPNGDYSLKIEVDPKNQIVESNDTDNVSTKRVRITDGTLTSL